MSNRGSSSPIAIVLLVAMTIIFGLTVFAMTSQFTHSGSVPAATFEGSINTSTNELAIVHTGGDNLELESTELHIVIDDESLAHQPPIPFFQATGFSVAPRGPFNSATENVWRPGERGTVTIASTNYPLPTPESTVYVEVIYNDQYIATISLDHR